MSTESISSRPVARSAQEPEVGRLRRKHEAHAGDRVERFAEVFVREERSDRCDQIDRVGHRESGLERIDDAIGVGVGDELQWTPVPTDATAYFSMMR